VNSINLKVDLKMRCAEMYRKCKNIISQLIMSLSNF
jgi:hypothetical protein